MKRWLFLTVILAALFTSLGYGFLHIYRIAQPAPAAAVPSTSVKRGTVIFTVIAKGDLQGGNSQTLTAPMIGTSELIITALPKPGDLVQEGDPVARFDTTEQEYKLREADADLAEAEQKLLEAQANADSRAEEDRFALLKAKSDVKLAELECRRNELISKIMARQNEIALEAARDNLRQLESDLGSRKATAAAGVAIQEAARSKAQALAGTARKNIESMTLRAKTKGYLSILPNMNNNMWFDGMRFPDLQVGDTVRPGMGVAQIPDLTSWEVTARLAETDRGHLALHQSASIRVIALPGRTFQGKVKNLGGTVGPPWDRRFETKLSLESPAPELRPGMSVVITITTEKIADALWIPAQALFESDGRTFVYLKTRSGFTPRDVKLVRRSESQVVLTGIQQGQLVALASPDQKDSAGGKDKKGNAMQALPQ